MKRRALLGLLGGAATWPLVARAQPSDWIRRIGMILPAAADDAEYQTWVGAFLQALGQSDWTIGRNIRLDIRWATPDPNRIRKHAAELAALVPDIIVAAGSGRALMSVHDPSGRRRANLHNTDALSKIW